MGGIFGVVCKEKIRRGVVFEGLRRLLYRGYDGVGVAFLDDEGNIVIRKKPGHLEKVANEVDLFNIPSRIALGHTRYASRGWPTVENTHPLTDCTGKIAVVGDGLIENYEAYKEKLVRKGHSFSSRTDTEVYAHLLEESVFREKKDPLEAIARYMRELRGMYAVAAIIAGKEVFYVAHNGQPLIIGLTHNNECIYLSSDIPSLYGYADEAYILEEGMAAEISIDNIRIINAENMEPISIERLIKKRVKYQVELVGKAGYPHYMLKEIYEIPDSMIKTTYSLMEKYLRLAAMIIYGAKNVYVIGNGTSLHAGMVSSYYFTDLANINVNVVSAAEFPYYALKNVSTGTVIIAISQSGETSDVIKSVKLAKQYGAVIIGVTNVVGSRLSLESNVYLPIGAGPELAVPATKTFVSSLVALALLAGYTGLYTGKLSQTEYVGITEKIRETAKELRKDLQVYDNIAEKISEKLLGWKNMYVSSSGINYPVALEASLKFKEASIIHAEGVQLGELRHGPLVLIRDKYPVIIIKPVEEEALPLYNKVAEYVLSKNGFLITITHDDIGYGEVVKVKPTHKILSPITTIIPLQLIAYHLGVKQGYPVDTPPGLAKAITT
ncbi:glutamine--fructose-6-phosphate transaminase [Staphylothermus marinus F1]|uniref:glutamine--fructose-6-phosphate transaminase (isomerizing) n=1 Tax=Staphylothermus marinus (strain ATCC 43588 / DSM 3639 / JCM 9404 / F1) TaxID=399550 RepID=A3DPP9_STAMF|nr:glutamine--fructose-6-phosphate transaminase (isomerizing) [Staphylothermus marinus]ABN70609.1 glutamine--fructose-6-phosphate transaminase [Staphylothermus marinus F1]